MQKPQRAQHAPRAPTEVEQQELQSARDEAGRRIAARDERATRRAAHEEQVGRFRAHIQAAIDKQAAAFPRSKDGEPHPLEQQVSEALVTLLLACGPPPEVDDPVVEPAELETVRLPELEAAQRRLSRMGRRDLADRVRALCDAAGTSGTVDAAALAECDLLILEAIAQERADRAAPPPAVGPPTLSELEAVLQRVDRTGEAVLVGQLHALCNAARTTGMVDVSALAGCDPRLVQAIAWERTDRARQQAWWTAPSYQAQPCEPLDVLTARILVERGRKRYEAVRLVTGMNYETAEDSSIRKRVDRAVKAQAELAASPEDEELSPEAIAELERMLAELERPKE